MYCVSYLVSCREQQPYFLFRFKNIVFPLHWRQSTYSLVIALRGISEGRGAINHFRHQMNREIGRGYECIAVYCENFRRGWESIEEELVGGETPLRRLSASGLSLKSPYPLGTEQVNIFWPAERLLFPTNVNGEKEIYVPGMPGRILLYSAFFPTRGPEANSYGRIEAGVWTMIDILFMKSKRKKVSIIFCLKLHLGEGAKYSEPQTFLEINSQF